MRKTPSVCFADTSLGEGGKGDAPCGDAATPSVAFGDSSLKEGAKEDAVAATRRQENEALQIF